MEPIKINLTKAEKYSILYLQSILEKAKKDYAIAENELNEIIVELKNKHSIPENTQTIFNGDSITFTETVTNLTKEKTND